MNPLPDIDPSRCVVYRRVSSAEQERASGPERQRKACERFAAANGLVIAADHFEDRSGTLPMSERPGLESATPWPLTTAASLSLAWRLVEPPKRNASRARGRREGGCRTVIAGPDQGTSRLILRRRQTSAGRSS